MIKNQKYEQFCVTRKLSVFSTKIFLLKREMLTFKRKRNY